MEQLIDEFVVALVLKCTPEPLGNHNRGEFLGRAIKVLVDNNIIEFEQMRDFIACVMQALRDDAAGVGGAVVEPRQQRLVGRRQNEDADGGRVHAAHLCRALPVDLQQDVVALGHARAHPQLRGAVVIAVYQRAFDKLAVGTHAFKLCNADKVVLTAIDFARTRRARGERH